jgi:hypothetical protein
MTDFGKTKITFALALLGTLFAIHPFVERYGDLGFDFPYWAGATILTEKLTITLVYSLVAGLLALGVYCYAASLLSERPNSFLEKLGNYSYAIAVLLLPLYGGLYLSSLLADRLDETHLAWAAPAVAIGLGIGWLPVPLPETPGFPTVPASAKLHVA